MEYTDEELKVIYDNIVEGRNSRIELNDIASQLHIILKNMEFDALSVSNIIDTLLFMNKHNQLYKVNGITIPLILKICMGKKDAIVDKDNTSYYDMIIKNVLLPSFLNRCDYDHNLPKFLVDFDSLIKLINENCDLRDLELIGEYNKPLCEIIKVWVKCVANYITSEFFFKSNNVMHMIIDDILAHMATILYLYIDEYDYNYELLFDAFCNIFNNYFGFMIQCIKNNIVTHCIDDEDKIENILKDYKFSSDILNQTLIPPIVIDKCYKK